ncbi:hypothetical protein LZF95_22735 [Algoriphagus sp. AGSA1]|uniref:hypothetical protein n=1 Tax=Algoriphagus sp. AGSA1 TaxID=2907213 RepID=UPI001F46925D|nr:hypothetical protein [Algoriphagus sp. AGSA1]MCE7057516.1 hypothetical protein [Algoriphagus sp. AGSA1]
MEQLYPELDLLIINMSEGDEAFQKELTWAIYTGLLELKDIYTKASMEKDDEKIQQIRHKLKPTLSIFELTHIIDELQVGKEIIENSGFDNALFRSHFQNLQIKLDATIRRVYELTL